MKFLVLALCVCAASAASFGVFEKQAYKQPYLKQYQPQPAVKVVAPVPYAAAKAFVQAPAPLVKTTYPAGRDAEAAIVRSDSEVNSDGFNYYYETNNGIAAQASGVTKKVGNEDAIVIQGSYKYTGDDGKEVFLTYVADENGYQPQSDVLPVGPPTPDAIVKALAYIRAHYKPENYKQDY